MSTENNKIIAEFLGFDILSNDRYNYQGEITTSLPEFNSDWSWLMVVVEKIESIYENRFVIEISDNMCEITGFEVDNNPKIYKCGSNKKEAVYMACVEFIKWYNQQSEKVC